MALCFLRSKCLNLTTTLIITFILKGQDIHFSQYYTFASAMNPALVGNYDGSFRLAALYRNQWGSILAGKAYQTVAADVDFSFLESYLRTDKLAVGVGFYNDISGMAGLSVLNASLSVAYHKGIDKDGKHRISLAAQGAYVQKRITDPLFADQFQGHDQTIRNYTAEDLLRGDHTFDFNAGLYWRSNFKEKVKVGAGFATYHIVQPKEDFIRDTFGVFGNLTRRYVADASIEAFITKKRNVSLTPEFILQYKDKQMEALPGLLVSYYFNTGFRNNNSVHLGGRYRLGQGFSGVGSDAFVFLAQLEYKNVRLGFAYDVNLSKLSVATQNRGGFEITLSYIGETIKSFKANKSLPSRRF
ncbi:MAG: PorP/SprF family type IX secretion system membrane protein [Chitinophagales bacterium]|nr:PorP/SprF family type IX secretion system membrane protein [Chitinophagales bacterium]MDW8273067.1 PorP/SprF family type IX secretion system membrane protein [Chitinophagales bacterium]